MNLPTHRRTRWRRACFARHYNYSHNALNQLASITQPSTTPSATNYGLGSCADASLIADLGNGSTGSTVAIPSAGTPGTATTGGAQTAKYTFTTDNEGRMTQKGTQAYVYDALNRMAQVTTKESYVYDGHGRRVQITKTSDGSINYPLYSLDGKLILEDNRQTLQRIEYIHAGGRLVAKRIQPITAAGANNGTATTTTIHTDFLGSPVAETNASGTVTRVERYTPYGEPSDMQLDAGPGFTGHATDVATGLTYMQQRYYDPEIIRFPVPDPVGPEEDFINHFNRYNYAMNNPVRYTDPDGREIVIPWNGIGEIASKRGAQAAVASQVDSPAPGPGDVVGVVILVGAVVEIGYNIYQANTTTNDEKVDGLIKTGTKEGESSTTKISRPGGEEARDKEFDDLGLKDVKDKGKGVKVGETDSGRRVVSRPSTEDGRPTIEVQRPDGKPTEKIRYDDKK